MSTENVSNDETSNAKIALNVRIRGVEPRKPRSLGNRVNAKYLKRNREANATLYIACKAIRTIMPNAGSEMAKTMKGVSDRRLFLQPQLGRRVPEWGQ